MAKIAFDAKRAVNNMTGLGNYSRLVIDTLSRLYPDNSYLLYAPKPRATPRLAPLLQRSSVELLGPDRKISRRLSSIWRVRGLSNQIGRDHVDLFHGLSNELPLTIRRAEIPTVVTIHDLIFRHFPQYYKPIDRRIYDYKFRRAAINATRVIAISQCTRRDLIDSYGIDPAKIDVIYQGCDQQFHRKVDADEIATVKARYGLDRPYIIGVGTIENRKNQMLTLEALAGLPSDIILVLVGRPTPYTTDIVNRAATLGLSDRLKIISGADFADFPALYAGALLSSYPSRFEGFGIPVIESLSVGTPVVVARGSCLEEAAGSDALTTDADSADELASQMLRLINDSALRQQAISNGLRHAATFSDDAMANAIMATYHQAKIDFSSNH
jgi:glycosyltransferase involved in cell wall biosynthesis